MTIYSHRRLSKGAEKEIKKDLSMFEWSSKTCRVEIVMQNCSVPAFDNLIILTLALHSGCYGWGVLTKLLERSSNLERLVLEHDHYHFSPCRVESELVFELEDSIEDRPEVLKWIPPESVPNCVLSHLKTVSLKGFKGEGFWGHLDEMEVIKHLLKNGQVLEKMTIYTEFRELDL